jgi:hypothetical protein
MIKQIYLFKIDIIYTKHGVFKTYQPDGTSTGNKQTPLTFIL